MNKHTSNLQPVDPENSHRNSVHESVCSVCDMYSACDTPDVVVNRPMSLCLHGKAYCLTTIHVQCITCTDNRRTSCR